MGTPTAPGSRVASSSVYVLCMSDVTEIQLPGVGVRYEFTTRDGERLAVLSHHGGRRELFRYDAEDPDRAMRLLAVDEGDARTLTELLGATQVSEVLGTLRQPIEGVALDWVEVAPGADLADRSIGDGELRSRTGCSVVAAIRDGETTPAPGPEFVLRSGDVLVAVGTAPGLEQLRTLIRG